jgi:ribonucleotide reductase alpha subunit
MLLEDVIIRDQIIGQIINSFSKDGINTFGDWLKHYGSTIEEVENFVNDYVVKVNDNKLDEIERFQKVIMMNALALYIVELDLDHYDIPDELIDRLLKIYVTTIRDYNRMLKGQTKLIGPVFISDISLYKFVEA